MTTVVAGPHPPPAPANSFNAAAAQRGEQVFNDPALGVGRCSRCHMDLVEFVESL